MTFKKGNWRLDLSDVSFVWQKKGRCLGGKQFGEVEEKEGGRDLLVTHPL